MGNHLRHYAENEMLRMRLKRQFLKAPNCELYSFKYLQPILSKLPEAKMRDLFVKPLIKKVLASTKSSNKLSKIERSLLSTISS